MWEARHFDSYYEGRVAGARGGEGRVFINPFLASKTNLLCHMVGWVFVYTGNTDRAMWQFIVLVLWMICRKWESKNNIGENMIVASVHSWHLSLLSNIPVIVVGSSQRYTSRPYKHLHCPLPRPSAPAEFQWNLTSVNCHLLNALPRSKNWSVPVYCTVLVCSTGQMWWNGGNLLIQLPTEHPPGDSGYRDTDVESGLTWY